MMEASCDCFFKDFSTSDVTSGENNKTKSGLVLTIERRSHWIILCKRHST
jgi:hypothetical protein